MPLLRTDDGPRRLRAVWLGPRGNRFWVEWTYVQWAVFAGLTVVFAVIVFALLYLADPGLAAMACVPWGLMASYIATKWIMDHADYDRPLRYWRWVLRTEWRRSQRVPREARVRVGAPTSHEMSREVNAVLYTRRDSRPRPLGLVEEKP
ncbi:MAG TPA: hypothetical protein VIP77_12795 [Jiangellaceae bacterium]